MLQAYVLGLFTSEYALNKAHEMYLIAYNRYWPEIARCAKQTKDVLCSFFVKKRVIIRTIEETFGKDD